MSLNTKNEKTYYYIKWYTENVRNEKKYTFLNDKKYSYSIISKLISNVSELMYAIDRFSIETASCQFLGNKILFTAYDKFLSVLLNDEYILPNKKISFTCTTLEYVLVHIINNVIDSIEENYINK